MPTLPAVIVTLLLPFEHLFDPRTWRKAQLLAMGAILSPGKRTVSSALNILGIGQHGDFAVYHHVLNRARWSPLQLSRVLLLLVAGRLGSSTEPLVFGIDETVERRWGRKIAGQGAVSGSGAVHGRPGGDDPRTAMGEPDVADAYRMGPGRHWALPFLTALVVSARYDRRKGRRHKTVTDYAQQMLVCLRRWLPDRDLVVVADGGYAKREFPAALPEYVKADCRRHQTAQGRVPVPARATAGGPARSGGPGWSARDCPVPRRCWTIPLHNGFPTAPPVPTAVPPGSSSLRAWRCGTTAGRRRLPIRWVVIRYLEERRGPYALLCTDTEAEPLRILQWYLLRWQVEVTFAELRAHLGVETQRQWSERAIARTTPALFGLFSVVTLAADILIEQRGGMAPRTAAWYDKTSPSFADAIALVRRHLWVQQGTFMPSEREHESIKVPRLLYHRMLDTLAYAA